MYLVVIDKYSGPPQILVFESKADFDRRFQRSWGKIVDEGISRESAQKLYGAIDLNPLEEKMYHVVFEFDETKGGLFRSRYSISYINEQEFNNSGGNEGLKIVSKGISEKEVEKMLFTVPPICRYMAAVEEAFYQESQFVPQQLEMKLSNTFEAVKADQQYLWEHLLATCPVDDELLEYYKKLTTPNTAKAIVMRTILVLYDIDLNDLNPLTKNETFLKTIKTQCKKALTLFPKE